MSVQTDACPGRGETHVRATHGPSMPMSTTPKATAAAKKSKLLPALIPVSNGATNQLAVVNTKSSQGQRVLRPWEYRAALNLSRKEAAEQYPKYFAEVSRELNTKVSMMITAGAMHVGAVTLGKGGNFTIKANDKLPEAEVVKETKAEKKVASVDQAMKEIERLQKLVADMRKDEQAKPAAAPAAPAAAPVTEGKTLDGLLAEAKTAAVTA